MHAVYTEQRSAAMTRCYAISGWTVNQPDCAEWQRVKDSVDETFPADGKRTRSAMIRQALAQKIVDYLKIETDKAFR